MQVNVVRNADPKCGDQCAEWISAQGQIDGSTPERFRAVLKSFGDFFAIKTSQALPLSDAAASRTGGGYPAADCALQSKAALQHATTDKMSVTVVLGGKLVIAISSRGGHVKNQYRRNITRPVVAIR